MQSTATFLGRLVLGIFISIGLLGSGFFIAKGIYRAKSSDRHVIVKGLAERSVKADLAAWEIDYREVDDDLVAANSRIQHDQDTVVAFLKQNGFQANEIEMRPAKVNDLFANPYNTSTSKYRYIVTSGVRVRSTQVDLISKVSQMTSTLIQKNIPISFDTSDYSADLNPNPSYYFTGLDKIRPAMLTEAARSANLVATQFANDTCTRLAGIRSASQGIFQIMGRDATESDNSQNQASALYKKVRLVTTIDYFVHTMKGHCQ